MSEVIAAISTPLMSAGLGVIRVSGENAAEIADRVFRSVGGKKLTLSSAEHIAGIIEAQRVANSKGIFPFALLEHNPVGTVVPLYPRILQRGYVPVYRCLLLHNPVLPVLLGT